MQLIVILSYITMAYSGVILESKHPYQATSFQSIHMEHFHPVPTYMKKEDMHYLEHPISEGQTESKVEIHHGSKHDPGYAFAAIHSEIHGHHDDHKFIASGGHSYPAHHEGKRYEEDISDVKQYVPVQYNTQYSEEVDHEANIHEEPESHYQNNEHNVEQEESNHDTDASYYNDGHEHESEENTQTHYDEGQAVSSEHY